jgi:hypothetical protein
MMHKENEHEAYRGITQKIFHNALICPRRGWEMRNNHLGNESSLIEQFRTEQLIALKKLARKLFPIGKLVMERDAERAATQTQYLINDPQVRAVFEATFISGGFVARADILVRGADGWDVKEIRPSTSERSGDIEGLAYVKMVAEHAGLRTGQCSLILVSPGFRLGMPHEKVFVEKDRTAEVRKLTSLLEPMMEPLEEVTRKGDRPLPGLRYECRDCMLFAQCVGKDAKHHIFSLPELSKKKFYELRKAGICDILRIPMGFKLTERQEIVRTCEITGKPHIGDGLGKKLDLIKFPVFYLDLEVVASCIPFYYDIAPHEPVPTIYSIHKCYEPGKVISHREYIADPRRDCRREMAKQLVRDLEKEGSIVVYSSFENTVLRNLAKENGDLAPKLLDVIKRLVDLEAIIRKEFYHPDFNGSTALKKTYPALTGTFEFEQPDIADAEHAKAAFAFMAMGRYQNDGSKMIKRKLLDYGKQNTYALVQLHQKLLEYA